MSPKTNTNTKSKTDTKAPTARILNDRKYVIKQILLDLEEVSTEAYEHLQENTTKYEALPVQVNRKKMKGPKVPKLTKTSGWTVFYKEKEAEHKVKVGKKLKVKDVKLTFDDHGDLRTKAADEWKEADKEDYKIKATEVNEQALQEWYKHYENRCGMTDETLSQALTDLAKKDNKEVKVYIKKHMKRPKMIHMLGCAGLAETVQLDTSLNELRKALLEYYEENLQN